MNINSEAQTGDYFLNLYEKTLIVFAFNTITFHLRPHPYSIQFSLILTLTPALTPC